MTQLYSVFDSQTGEYYRESLTLEQAKEIAVCFMERSTLEQGRLSKPEQENNIKLLNEIMQNRTESDVRESLALFDYELERL